MLNKKTLFIFVILMMPVVCHAQEYMYDGNGNLSQDANKQIASIRYNMLNLPDTILYSDGRKIIYTYTASGQKLRQQVFSANGTLLHKQDYVSDFVYRNDTLREVEHAQGRVVPLLPGNLASAWDYQYHLTDHLGNVRSTITPFADTVEYMATMESAQALQEEKIFTGLSDRRVSYTQANHTLTGKQVVRLLSNTENGFSMNLAVKSGDVINLRAYAYYEGNASTTKNTLQLNALLPVIMSVVSSGVVTGVEGQSNMLAPADLTGTLTSTNAKSKPVAHLNYQLFDKDYKQIDAGYAPVTDKASYAQELLTLAPITIKKSGYLLVYLSNTSADNTVVYFDDVEVQHILSPVVQEDGYYPFGMTLAEQHDERFREEPNRHLFNGKELQHDFDLDWYDYGARMYDAALGRWNHIDPKAEAYVSWSPYQYVANNPIKFIDPHGEDIVIWYVENGKDKSFNYNGGTPKNIPNNKFVKQVVEAWNYNVKNGGGDNLKKIASSKTINVNIRETTTPNFEDVTKEGSVTTGRGNRFQPKSNTILWDPYGASATDEGVTISPATQLEHESDHAVLEGTDPEKAQKLFDAKIENYGDEEEKRVITGSEQKTALANGEIKKGGVTRKNHDGIYVKTSGPTSTKNMKEKKDNGLVEELK